MAKVYPPKPTKAALNTWKGLTTTPKGAASLKKKIAENKKAEGEGLRRGAAKIPKVKLKPGSDRIVGGAQPFMSGKSGKKSGPPRAGRKI